MIQDDIRTTNELRRLGITIAVFLALIGWVLLWNEFIVAFVFSFSAVILLCIALIRPSLLLNMSSSWESFVNLLGLMIPKIILTIIFYLILTPISLFIRFKNSDRLFSRTNHDSVSQQDHKPDSYWVLREKDTVDRDRMKKLY